MKAPFTISVPDYLADPTRFNDLFDVRSPAEFALDHLPGALNAPVLTDAQRILIGTLDKQVSSFEAKRQGAALVSRNIANLLDSTAFQKSRDWTPLVYCWRGGNRSASLAHVLRKIGWPSAQLEGGYKAFRTHIIADLESLPAQLEYRVLTGRTGVGKTQLLDALTRQGAQVLCLEGLARHRGSLLGAMPEAQPSQKAFETQLWHSLRGFDRSKPVFIEAESAKVGNVRVPESLVIAMRGANCTNINASMPQRVTLLCEQYTHFFNQPEVLKQKLAVLTQLHGNLTVSHWNATIDAGAWNPLVESLLRKHYDPAYDRALTRNFVHLDHALQLDLPGTNTADFDTLAQRLIA